MGVPTTAIQLNKTTPASPSGQQNVVFQSDNGTPQQNVTAYDPVMVGDSGSGGTAGNVPAAPAGAAAANEFLHAGGSFKPLPHGLDILISNGAMNSNVALIPPARFAFTATKCVVFVKQSDSTTNLTFDIQHNGVNIFSANPSVPAGASAGTVLTFTSFATSPLSVAIGDTFTMDINSGTSNWQFTAQLF